jgi:GTPase SAR1 family protein
MRFNVWDTSGQRNLVAKLPDEFYENTSCVILMFDLDQEDVRFSGWLLAQNEPTEQTRSTPGE